MKSLFEGIEDLFVNVLFAPLDALRFTESWTLSNVLNWIFMLIGFVAFVYWMLELKKYNDNGEEDKTITSHSYL
ncbi:uracil phosphoribosyltransferase [Maribacter sp. PR1]|uniref:Uracil phosphoribosyltransferase n=1 Tax=Maribacter cobaltidurans TaxID=1178778 RepID=A0ABU7IQE4_9FLAO|nr:MULTISPECIES: uracil phosphoribosyltransferase [Maribacter]MDC6387786.1 uracil phosphoribosyltransferase [Maribacter sp. PR1]MEE1975175.1 uracil phosphoribosyltransferase [Maribacter cobaltidurans]